MNSSPSPAATPVPPPPTSPLVTPLLVLLRGYQRWISPLLGPRCRFYPTCSSYALQALSAHGLLAGGWLTARRVLRCQPFAQGGVDPVPAVGQRRRVRRLGPDARPKASNASSGAPPC